jgi:hypothetical protein
LKNSDCISNLYKCDDWNKDWQIWQTARGFVGAARRQNKDDLGLLFVDQFGTGAIAQPHVYGDHVD